MKTKTPDLQTELDKLFLKRDELTALPKVIDDPLKYAELVAKQVSDSAPKVREIDALIERLQNEILKQNLDRETENLERQKELERVELEGIFEEYRVIGKELDAIAVLEAEALMKLRGLFDRTNVRLQTLTSKQVVRLAQESEGGDVNVWGRRAGHHRYLVRVENGLVDVVSRSALLSSTLEVKN